MREKYFDGCNRIFACIAALALSIAACAPQLGPPPGASSPQPETAAPENSVVAEAARQNYVAAALAPAGPPAVAGHRLIGEGTGFYVARDRVVTNAHVAGDCAVRTVGNDTEGAEVAATLVAEDKVHDLALLAVAAAGEPAAFAALPPGKVGGDFAVVGYPAHGLAVRVAELRRVSAQPADLDAGRPTYPFHGEVHPGNSGSPVLDDNGAVVGIVVQKIDTPAVYRRTGQVIEDIGVAIAERVVLDFLRANGVAPAMASQGAARPDAALLADSHRFVRQIGCWR